MYKTFFQANTALMTHVAATWFLVGLIWVIQIVHYPSFAMVDMERYVSFQEMHQSRITWIVAPLMFLELITGILLLLKSFAMPKQQVGLPVVGFGLILLIWLSTAFIQVPAHAQLAEGFSEVAHQRLVNSNWIRTVAWSLRGGIVLWMLQQSIEFARQHQPQH